MAFSDEIAKATDSLQEFSTALDSAGSSAGRAGAGPGRGGAGGGGGAGGAGVSLSRAAAKFGGLSAGLRAVGAGLEMGLATGTASGFATGFYKTALQIGGQIPLFGALSGAKRQSEILNATEASVMNDLGKFAEFNIDVDPNVQSQLIDTRLQQQLRKRELADSVIGDVWTPERAHKALERPGGGKTGQLSMLEHIATTPDRWADVDDSDRVGVKTILQQILTEIRSIGSGGGT